MTIYDYITEKEVEYIKEIELEDGWNWSMKDHLRKSFLYLNSQFDEHNENRELRPFKNIVLPILNIQFRTEGFDVKDIELYIDNSDKYYKSLLIRKFHNNKWALDNAIDTFIDELVASYCTYGGMLARNTNKARPGVVDLRSIVFCNQTDILNYPFGIKHEFSFAELRKMKKWDKNAIEKAIALAKKEEKDMVEATEVHGELPKEWLGEESTDEESEEDVGQIQVVTFYKDDAGNKVGITLFSNKEPKLPFKFLRRDKVSNRALGRGGVEELFDPQIWTNWNEVKVTEMLEAASKMINLTDDPGVAARHPSGLKDVENMEFIEIKSSPSTKGIWQMDTTPRNLAVFNDTLDRWHERAQLLGAGSDPLLGETPTAGTPFKLFEAQQIESKSLHRWRQGQIAVFMDEIYRDWIIPHIAKEIVKDQSFLAELSADEIQEIAEQITENEKNKLVVEKILNGELIDKQELEEFKQTRLEEFRKGGNKRFFKILKNEMKDDPLGVMTNIAGKQKNLALLTDKVVNVLRQYIATPEIRQDPGMNKLLNIILESSGLSPIMFNPTPIAQAVPTTKGTTEPLKELAQAQL